MRQLVKRYTLLFIEENDILGFVDVPFATRKKQVFIIETLLREDVHVHRFRGIFCGLTIDYIHLVVFAYHTARMTGETKISQRIRIRTHILPSSKNK